MARLTRFSTACPLKNFSRSFITVSAMSCRTRRLLAAMCGVTKEVRSGRLRCALDVTDPLEPLPIRHPLRTLPGAIVTPHIAASNRRVRHDIADTVMNDLEKFFKGHAVENRVSRAMLDRMT